MIVGRGVSDMKGAIAAFVVAAERFITQHPDVQMSLIITGDEEAYKYLVESIRRFPKPDNFSREIEAAGFSHVRHEKLSGGIVALHSAWRV